MSRIWFVIAICSGIINTRWCVGVTSKWPPSRLGHWVVCRQKCRNLEYGPMSKCNLLFLVKCLLFLVIMCLVYLSREPFQEFCGHTPLQSYIFYLVVGQCFHTYKEVLLEILVFSLTTKRLSFKHIVLMYRMFYPISEQWTVRRNQKGEGKCLFLSPDAHAAFSPDCRHPWGLFQSRSCMARCVLLVHES